MQDAGAWLVDLAPGLRRPSDEPVARPELTRRELERILGKI